MERGGHAGGLQGSRIGDPLVVKRIVAGDQNRRRRRAAHDRCRSRGGARIRAQFARRILIPIPAHLRGRQEAGMIPGKGRGCAAPVESGVEEQLMDNRRITSHRLCQCCGQIAAGAVPRKRDTARVDTELAVALL